MATQVPHSFISYVVFFATLVVVCLHLTSIIFPALIVTVASPHENDLNPLEIGSLAVPLFIANILLLGIGYVYYKKKLPSIIHKGINYVLTFELSRKSTLIVAVILLSIYIGLAIPELTIDESTWPDYKVFEEAQKVWPFEESSDPYVAEQRDRHVRMFLLSASLNIFQNVKIIPFIASILLLVATYFLTVEISKKRFAGIISMVIILQSFTFLEYDTVAIYENFWVLFYVLSLYFIYKRWYLSSISYILSIFSKAITASFIPMSLFFIYRTGISSRKKILTVISYAIVIGITLVIWQSAESIYNQVIEVDFSDFWIGTTVWSHQLRSDVLMILAILPLIVGLLIKSRQKILAADSVMFLILGAFLTGPILVMMTDFYFIHPYRFVPLVVFFAIGIGTFLSNKKASD